MVGTALSPCHQHGHNPGGRASGGSQKASSHDPLREVGAKAGRCPGGTVHPISRSCNSSSPPLNLLEELVWKFQPIFKGYFHSSEIYQRRRVIFTARSNCRLPWQRAGRNAIKHPSVIVNTKGTTGTEKKGDCHGGRKATLWCTHQDLASMWAHGAMSREILWGPLYPCGFWGPREVRISELPTVSAEGTVSLT